MHIGKNCTYPGFLLYFSEKLLNVSFGDKRCKTGYSPNIRFRIIFINFNKAERFILNFVGLDIELLISLS